MFGHLPLKLHVRGSLLSNRFCGPLIVRSTVVLVISLGCWLDFWLAFWFVFSCSWSLLDSFTILCFFGCFSLSSAWCSSVCPFSGPTAWLPACALGMTTPLWIFRLAIRDLCRPVDFLTSRVAHLETVLEERPQIDWLCWLRSVIYPVESGYYGSRLCQAEEGHPPLPQHLVLFVPGRVVSGVVLPCGLVLDLPPLSQSLFLILIGWSSVLLASLVPFGFKQRTSWPTSWIFLVLHRRLCCWAHCGWISHNYRVGLVLCWRLSPSPSMLPMQKSVIPFAEAGEPGLLILSVPAEISASSQDSDCFAIPVMSRNGGFLICVLRGVFSEDVLFDCLWGDHASHVIGPSNRVPVQLHEAKCTGSTSARWCAKGIQWIHRTCSRHVQRWLRSGTLTCSPLKVSWWPMTTMDESVTLYRFSRIIRQHGFWMVFACRQLRATN